MSDALLMLADASGIAREYHDIWGGHHPTSDSARQDLLAAMHLDMTRDPAELIAALQAQPKVSLPELAQRCFQPAALRDNGRIWGLSIQLYSLRSRRNWGIGDFTDLAALVDVVASAGGDFIGLNPLHALFPDNPAHISPYSPSHRAYLNTLYIDVEAVPEFAACNAARCRLASADFQARLAALRATEVVDYVGVAEAKFEMLPLLFEQFKQTGEKTAFAAWRKERGSALERHARYEALQAHFRQTEGAWGWPAWPQAYRDPDAQAVADFATTHADAVSYSAWLQWVADTQLAAVAARTKQRGMAIGLYQDLAVGANSGGSEVWSWQSIFAIGNECNGGASTGAPPDELNLLGQDWGLPPFVPHRLRAAGYQPFIDILRANMRHAGALRIDHVMGLTRLFWVPPDTPATEGAYVHYTFDDLLGLVANESLRNSCLVIGEDLGTVPEGFRERLFEAGVLSYHPLIFERYPDGQFRLPADMPQQALVAASTHDLPTLAGFWRGVDLDVRTRLMLFPSDEIRQRLITERDWDRGRLLWALEREGLLPEGVDKEPIALPELTPEVIAGIHAYLARSPAMLLVVQPEDLLAVQEQINVPGTLENQHPNWQRKLPLPIEDWSQDAHFASCIAAIKAER